MIKNISNNYKLEHGFTLIELIISIALSLTCMIIIFNLILHTTNIYQSSFYEDEIFENITLAMDFFEKQIRASEKIIIPLDEENKKILTVQLDKKEHDFIYDRNANENSIQYQRLNFGNNSNRLAIYIEDIKLNYNTEKNILVIKIYPNNEIDEDFFEFPPVIRSIQLQHKNIIRR